MKAPQLPEIYSDTRFRPHGQCARRCFQLTSLHVVPTVDHREIVKISKVLMFIAAAFTKFGKLMSVKLVFYRRQTTGYTELTDRIPRN